MVEREAKMSCSRNSTVVSVRVVRPMRIQNAATVRDGWRRSLSIDHHTRAVVNTAVMSSGAPAKCTAAEALSSSKA